MAEKWCHVCQTWSDGKGGRKSWANTPVWAKIAVVICGLGILLNVLTLLASI